MTVEILCALRFINSSLPLFLDFQFALVSVFAWFGTIRWVYRRLGLVSTIKNVCGQLLSDQLLTGGGAAVASINYKMRYELS